MRKSLDKIVLKDKEHFLRKSISLKNNFYSRIKDWDIENLIRMEKKIYSPLKNECKKIHFISYKIDILEKFSTTEDALKYKDFNGKKVISNYWNFIERKKIILESLSELKIEYSSIFIK